VVYQAEVHLRTDITGKLTHPRQYHRDRRSRKTRYRVARWANRRRRSGLLLPSLHTQAEATVKVVRFAASFLPISGVKVEIGSFEREVLCSRGIHRQNNPGGGPKPVTSPCAVPAWLDTCHDSSIAKRRCALPPLAEVRGPRAHVFMDGLDEGMFPR
jgi:RRXRR protein